MFRTFIDKLKTRFQNELPGEDVQFSMAPLSRERIRELPKDSYSPQKSAVLILIYPHKEGIQTLLIQRPIYAGVHSGQIAFPGGKFEAKDVHLEQTALREAFEEVGLDPNEVEIIGRLTDIYIRPSNFLVSPFVGYASNVPSLKADMQEVEKIITTNLFDLNKAELKKIKSITQSTGYKIKTPYYEIEGFTVWGATAMMISELNVLVAEAMLIS